MEFKEKLISSHLAFEDVADLPENLHQSRISALKVFEKKGFPTKKDEAWKYTSLLNLVNQDYSLFPRDVTNIELKEVKKYFLYDTDTYKVIFIDGVYSPFLSNTTHDGIDVCLLSAALTKPKYKKLIETYFCCFLSWLRCCFLGPTSMTDRPCNKPIFAILLRL